MNDLNLGPTLLEIAREHKEVRWLLEHPTNAVAFTAMERAVVREWLRAETVEARERVRIKMDVVNEWKRELRAISSRLPKSEE